MFTTLVLSTLASASINLAAKEDLVMLHEVASQRDLAVAFTQETLTTRGKIRLRHGSALIARDGRFYWSRFEPHREDWIFDGDAFFFFSGRSSESFHWTGDHEVARSVKQVVAIFSDVSSLEHGMRIVTIQYLPLGRPGNEPLYVEFEPRAAGDFERLSAVFERDTGFVLEVSMTMKGDRLTRYRFYNHRPVRLPSDAFEPLLSAYR